MKRNSEQYVLNKAIRMLKTIKGKIHKAQMALRKRTACNNYYNPIHVRKRELNRQKTITNLREERQQLKHTKEKQRKKIRELESLVTNQKLLMTQHKCSKDSNSTYTCSTKVNEALTNSKFKFLYKQKCSEVKQKNRQLRNSQKHCSSFCKCHTHNETTFIPELKNNGVFVEDVRLCIINLIGLEVSTDKVSEAIQVVASTIFHVDIKLDNLPSRVTVLNICSEGHYISKLYCATQLSETEHYGIGADGTSRKGLQITERHITLASGSQIPLGFNSVSSETATNITEGIKREMHELCEILQTAEDNTLSGLYLFIVYIKQYRQCFFHLN